MELLCPLLFGFGLPLDAHSWARKADRICNDSSSYSNEMLILPSNSFWWYFPHRRIHFFHFWKVEIASFRQGSVSYM